MKKFNGYTILEFTVTLVLLVVLIVISISVIFPQIKRARREAFIDEANNISMAAIHKYTQEGVNDDNNDDLYDHSNSLYDGKSCYSIASLKGKYINKLKDSYTGSVEVCYSSKCLYKTKIWLTDGSLYLDGARDTVIMVDIKENVKNINKCGIKN